MRRASSSRGVSLVVRSDRSTVPSLIRFIVTTDVNALIGPYPFRHVPHPDPEVLVRVLAREQLSGAWVGHLPSAFYRDPTAGNAVLYSALRPFDNLRPVPTIRPDWPGWERELSVAVDQGAPAVRAYP